MAIWDMADGGGLRPVEDSRGYLDEDEGGVVTLKGGVT